MISFSGAMPIAVATVELKFPRHHVQEWGLEKSLGIPMLS